MLEEMGIKLVGWRDAPVVVEAAAEAPATAVLDAAEPAPTQEVAVIAVRQPPAAAPAPPATPTSMPASHGAAVLAEPPCLLDGATAATGGWLIVADMPPEPDGRHGEPFAGDAGQLLDNMLRALKLRGSETPVHLMRTHRGVASGQPGSPRPVAEAFGGAIAALAPRLVLAMGPLAAQSLMQSAEPLGKLRGRVLALPTDGGPPLVATYHPAYLLRNPADKGRAWADLCLAAAQWR